MVYIKHLGCRSFSSEDLCTLQESLSLFLLISQICIWLQDPCGVTILPLRPDHVKKKKNCRPFPKYKTEGASRFYPQI